MISIEKKKKFLEKNGNQIDISNVQKYLKKTKIRFLFTYVYFAFG